MDIESSNISKDLRKEIEEALGQSLKLRMNDLISADDSEAILRPVIGLEKGLEKI